jgi:hypothetical protein
MNDSISNGIKKAQAYLDLTRSKFIKDANYARSHLKDGEVGVLAGPVVELISCHDTMLEKIKLELGSWSDGKKVVYVDDGKHIDVVRAAISNGVKVMIGNFEQNIKSVETCIYPISTFFIVSSKHHTAAVNKLKSNNTDLDIRFFPI